MNTQFFMPSKWRHPLFLTAIFGFSLLGPLLANQLPTPPGTDPSHVSRLSTFNLYLIALFLSPIFETALFQHLPFVVARKFLESEGLVFLAVVLPFSVAHFISSAPLPSLINGLIGGVSLGTCYITCMRSSNFFYAFSITASIHSAHNATVLALM